MEEIASGIYKITQINTGKLYIGLSTDIYARRANHMAYLKSGRHPNSELQNDVNKYGLKSIKFDALELVPSTDREILLDRERFWVEKYGVENCYNSPRFMNSNRINPIAYSRIKNLQSSNGELRDRIKNLENQLEELKRFSEYLETEIEQLEPLKREVFE